ncbi:MAG: NHL repeat-containing protein [Candidatus Binatia bacterium]
MKPSRMTLPLLVSIGLLTATSAQSQFDVLETYSSGVVVAPSGDAYLIGAASGAYVQRLAVATGGRCEIVSDLDTGTGLPMGSPAKGALEAGGTLVVSASSSDAVFRVDPVTGNRTVVSGLGVGLGTALDFPYPITVEASGDILVADNSNRIFRIDPASGDRTVLSSTSVGTGPDFITPRGLAVEASGDILVANFNGDSIFRVDPATGDRTVVSDAVTGAGDEFGGPWGVAVAANGDILIADAGGTSVLRVDPVSGDRTLISGPSLGSGESIDTVTDIAELANGQLLVSDNGTDLLVVDPVTGFRAPWDCLCGSAPLATCTEAGKASLLASDKSEGREKLKAGLKGLVDETTLVGFGDPVTGNTEVAVCVYSDESAVASMLVDVPGGDCDGKPCWKAKSTKGFGFASKSTVDGVSKLGYGSGAPGKGKVTVGAAANGSQGLARGIAGALSGSLPTVQVVTSDGFCAVATMTEAKKDDGILFKGKK